MWDITRSESHSLSTLGPEGRTLIRVKVASSCTSDTIERLAQYSPALCFHLCAAQPRVRARQLTSHLAEHPLSLCAKKRGMNAFAARLNAAEGTYFRAEQQGATERHLQKMVQEGKLPQSALSAINEAAVTAASYASGRFQELPTTVINSRPASELIFQYDGTPVPRMSATEAWARLGTTKVSFGRARWNADGASIFSVQDGKRLAQTPVKEPTAFELSRMRKIADAAVDKRVVSGVRLMPEYTPARAMLWGSILAFWGTGAVVMSAARALDIHSTEEASAKLRQVMTPYVGFSERVLQPIKEWFHAQHSSANVQDSLLPVSELAKRMRNKLGHQRTQL